MIYTSLTDSELRLAVDNSPHDIAIRDEVVKRFLNAETPDEIRAEDQAAIERLEADLSSAEDRESEAWAQVSELNDDVQKLRYRIKALTA